MYQQPVATFISEQLTGIYVYTYNTRMSTIVIAFCQNLQLLVDLYNQPVITQNLAVYDMIQ